MGAPLNAILNGIALLIEGQISGAIASILLLDDDGIHMRHGAAPHLPHGFWQAIDGLPIGPQVGSCGTAMFRKETVITDDIGTDPLWENYRELALRHDLLSCWSSPIMTRDGHILGAFGIYYEKPFRPQETDFAMIRMATHLASVALEKHRNEVDLRESKERFQSIASNVPGMVFQFVMRADGRREWPFVSEGCRDLYDISPQEIQANPLIPFDLLHPDDRAYVG